jgi:predicted GTPase
LTAENLLAGNGHNKQTLNYSDFKQSIHSIAGRIDTKRQQLVIVVNKCDLLSVDAAKKSAKTDSEIKNITKEVEAICKAEKVKAKVLCTILRLATV